MIIKGNTSNSKRIAINGQKAKVTFVYSYKDFIDKIVVQFIEKPLQNFVMYSDSTSSLIEHSAKNPNSYIRIWYFQQKNNEFFSVETSEDSNIKFDLLSKAEPSILEKIEFIKLINSEIMNLSVKTI